jgi:hypothetical protein
MNNQPDAEKKKKQVHATIVLLQVPHWLPLRKCYHTKKTRRFSHCYTEAGYFPLNSDTCVKFKKTRHKIGTKRSILDVVGVGAG